MVCIFDFAMFHLFVNIFWLKHASPSTSHIFCKLCIVCHENLLTDLSSNPAWFACILNKLKINILRDENNFWYEPISNIAEIVFFFYQKNSPFLLNDPRIYIYIYIPSIDFHLSVTFLSHSSLIVWSVFIHSLLFSLFSVPILFYIDPT